MHDELTKEDIQKMQEELDYRRLELMPELIEEVKRTRAFGDLSENFEYKAAKQAQNKNRSRIRYLEGMIKTAKIIEDRSDSDTVGLFDEVTIYLPEGEWLDLNTGEEYTVGKSGQWLRSYRAELEELPTFYNKNTESEIAPTLVDGVMELYDYARSVAP